MNNASKAAAGSTNGAPPAKAARTRGERAGLLLLVLAGLTAIGPAMTDMYLAAFPEMSDDFGVGASQLQLTLTSSMIGTGVGQLLLGPLSDRYGRRPPLVIGMALFTAASLLCAFAPSYEWFLAGRVAQGLTGAAGVVISRAIVRDLFSGDDFVRYFAKIMLVFGLAPVLAPLVGAGLLGLGSWQYIFYALAAFALLLLLGSATVVGETLPPERRSSGGVLGALKLMRLAVRDRRFVLYSLGNSFAFAAMFAYIGSFSFVVQDVFGGSSFLFALLFGINACGFVAAGQISAKLVGRVRPHTLVIFGSGLQVVATLVLGAYVLLTNSGGGTFGLVVVQICCLLLMTSLGTLMPNSTGLALEGQAESAGTAAALMGCAQLLAGAIAAPLVGVAGSDTAVPLGCITAVCAVVGFLFFTQAKRVPSMDLS